MAASGLGSPGPQDSPLPHPHPQIHRENMVQALSPDMLATDLAYYLVRKGVSVGRLGWRGQG